MKILSLNCWGGKLHDDLLEFVSKSAASVDVFCFQEVCRDTGETELVPPFHSQSARNLFDEFREILADYEAEFATPYKAAERGFVDDVIEPRTTRKRIIDALGMLAGKRERRPGKKHGNIPL